MKVGIKHYVEYYYPGFFVSESSEEEIEGGLKFPKNAYGFRFFDRKISSDNETEMKSDKLNISPLHFIGGERMTLAEVKEKMPEKNILINNMETNDYPEIVNTKFGQLFPLEKGSKIFSR